MWQSAVAHHAVPGYRDEWVTVSYLPKAILGQHPWSFSEENSDTRDVLESVAHRCLREVLAEKIGYGCITRTDEAFIQPPWVLRRFGIEAGRLGNWGAEKVCATGRMRSFR